MTSVQQNVFVFNDTIRNNVTMFHEFPDKEVTLALERSGLSEFIEKRGEEFVCGENGANLSGGERQRISIARALLRKSPILLVDEATAALDAATARAVSFSILNLVGMTRIVVTHRLEEAILRRYDKILVMKNGTICEQGNFDTLMQQKGQFYSLFQNCALKINNSWLKCQILSCYLAISFQMEYYKISEITSKEGRTKEAWKFL